MAATNTRRHRGRTVAMHATSPTAQQEAPGPLTFAEAQSIARSRDVCLYVRDLGPFYRVVCREGDEDGKVLGVTTGFVVPPLRLMHCDTLQVFTRGLRGDEGWRLRGGLRGLGLLLGVATFSYGAARGCTKAEILAINDNEETHQRLVKYYKYFGFRPVVEVEGGRLSDLPHMLVWGGVGTRMDADIHQMLKRWTPVVRAPLKSVPQETLATTVSR